MTGSQLPLLNPRTDARTNLLDAITCATAYFTPPHIQLQEVCVCFGGLLLRGNRAQKVDSMMYRAFASPTMAPLATLGVEVQWNKGSLLQPEGTYRPRFKLYACFVTCSVCFHAPLAGMPTSFVFQLSPAVTQGRRMGIWWVEASRGLCSSPLAWAICPIYLSRGGSRGSSSKGKRDSMSIWRASA